MIVNVINLPKRTDRLESFKMQAEINGFEYKIWEGKIDRVAIFRGISDSHKQIVMDAMTRKLPMVCIAEDDVVFFEGGWKYFIDNIPERFQMYFSMIYEGEIDENNRIKKSGKSIAGLTCYIVHESFYVPFLNMNPLNHIDKEIGTFAEKYEFYVAPEFVCKQTDGWSDNKNLECKYDHLLKGRKLFGII